MSARGDFSVLARTHPVLGLIRRSATCFRCRFDEMQMWSRLFWSTATSRGIPCRTRYRNTRMRPGNSRGAGSSCNPCRGAYRCSSSTRGSFAHPRLSSFRPAGAESRHDSSRGPAVNVFMKSCDRPPSNNGGTSGRPRRASLRKTKTMSLNVNIKSSLLNLYQNANILSL